MEKSIEKLLWGDKKESKIAKDSLKKLLDKKLAYNWKSEKQALQDREKFKEEVLSVYEQIFTSYSSVSNHNKCNVLSFLSHSLFYYKNDISYFKKFLIYVRDALRDATDGNLRQIAVRTTSNSYSLSLTGFLAKNSKKAQEDFNTYFGIATKHLTLIFDELETYIETDERLFPITVKEMMPSVMKSHLLYLFEFDRFDTLMELSGMYEEEDFFKENKLHTIFKNFFKNELEKHPSVKKFIEKVPIYEDENIDEDDNEFEYSESEIPKIVKDILDADNEKGIPSYEFFSGESIKDFLGGFSAPSEAYFEIMDLVGGCDDGDSLFETFNVVYHKACTSPISEIYWYDVIDFILSKLDDDTFRLKMLGEAIKKLSTKIDVLLPIDIDGMNSITYGIPEHRPIFRILAAFAVGNQECGNIEMAKIYYEFLLKCNPWDNQGIRYMLASLYAGRPASYVGELFDEGNRTFKWDKVENFLEEENKKYHFWNEPKE